MGGSVFERDVRKLWPPQTATWALSWLAPAVWPTGVVTGTTARGHLGMPPSGPWRPARQHQPSGGLLAVSSSVPWVRSPRWFPGMVVMGML